MRQAVFDTSDIGSDATPKNERDRPYSPVLGGEYVVLGDDTLGVFSEATDCASEWVCTWPNSVEVVTSTCVQNRNSNRNRADEQRLANEQRLAEELFRTKLDHDRLDLAEEGIALPAESIVESAVGGALLLRELIGSNSPTNVAVGTDGDGAPLVIAENGTTGRRLAIRVCDEHEATLVVKTDSDLKTESLRGRLLGILLLQELREWLMYEPRERSQTATFFSGI